MDFETKALVQSQRDWLSFLYESTTQRLSAIEYRHLKSGSTFSDAESRAARLLRQTLSAVAERIRTLDALANSDTDLPNRAAVAATREPLRVTPNVHLSLLTDSLPPAIPIRDIQEALERSLKAIAPRGTPRLPIWR